MPSYWDDRVVWGAVQLLTLIAGSRDGGGVLRPSRIDFVKLGRVEFLVEVGTAVVGEAVEAAVDLFEQPVSSELLGAATGMVRRRTSESLDRTGRQVPLLADQLQDPIVGRNHPLGGLSHVVRSCGNCAHILPDVEYLNSVAYQTTGNAVAANSNPE